ncbi:Bacterial extracellular solute-binding proteins, family 3 [Marinomonas gallaica]|uniref:Bacterial extracellular solute-binding proteins, family 3 n=1 Tax=Marinomonas gallaica TaxID=1806667 RepID=A0A1C3JTL6_9GAMM|nr:transporter substrate-binding domain-containing protein [Marinomonas gallaica]SBT18467.1 Bacterial extracellular solute-binding proteins, family 3 [Marinomonas gallaica]SBT22669.1 Bacterial extracellular solute-binding proteins, family 3 [Marinomonas gallaica]
MKKLTKFFSALAIALPLTVQAQTVDLTTMNWPPFYGDSLEKGGFISAIVDEALAESGYDSTIEFTAWQTALDTVKAGDKDAIVGGYYSEERAQEYYFSIPIYTVLAGLIKKPDFPLSNYDSFESLDQYSIAKLKGSVIGESFDNFPFSDLKEYPEVSDAIKALDSGEVQLYADSLAVAKEAAEAAGIDASQLQILLPPLEENDLYLLISKSIPNAEELRDAFNKGLMEIQMSGRYDEILAEFNQQ